MNGPVEAPGLVNLALCTFVCRGVARPGLGVPQGPLEICGVGRFPILSFPTASSRHGSVVSYFQSSGIENIRLHTASLATLIRLATDGVGLAAIPVVTIERELAAGVLRELAVSTEFPPIPLYAMHLERSEEHTSELQSLMRISYAVFCLKNNINNNDDI